jgi:hypothetical protein
MTTYIYLPIILCLLPTSLAKAAQRDIEIIAGTTVDRLTMAFTGGLQTPTMLREVHLKTPLPDGTVHNGVLVIARDTASGRFWWMLAKSGNAPPERLSTADWAASHAAIYVAENTIVMFWTIAPGQLSTVERPGQAAGSLDEAQQLAVAAIQRRAAEYERGKMWAWDGTTVKLPRSLIPFEFWHPPFQPNMPRGATKVVSVSKDGKNWKLVLRDQWDQELILDESYGVVSSRRLDSTTQGGK